MPACFEDSTTNLVAAWFCYGLTSVHSVPSVCWPHLRLLTNDDTALFQPCSTLKLAWMLHCHETLPAWGVHTTTGKVLLSFHTDKHSVFIPYLFQACRHRVHRRPIRNYFVPFSSHTGIMWTGPELGSRLSKQKSISEIEQKAFVLLLINRRIFFGTPGRTGLTFNVTGGTTPSKFQGCLPLTYTVQSMHLTYGPMSGRLPS